MEHFVWLWRMFHTHLRIMCILLLLNRMFFICLFSPLDLKYGSSLMFPCLICLNDLCIVESKLLTPSSIIVLLSISP